METIQQIAHICAWIILLSMLVQLVCYIQEEILNEIDRLERRKSESVNPEYCRQIQTRINKLECIYRYLG